MGSKTNHRAGIKLTTENFLRKTLLNYMYMYASSIGHILTRKKFLDYKAILNL